LVKAERLLRIRLEMGGAGVFKRLRDPDAVRSALATLGEVAATGEGNILAAAVEAARARATVGEISDVLRSVFGDHEAKPEVVENVYAAAYAGEPEFTTLVLGSRRFRNCRAHNRS
jgi:methylmalonyl-CoA mutase